MSGDRGPTWLYSKLDQRLAKLENEAGIGIAATGAEVVMTPLTEPADLGLDDGDIEVWERTCDNCSATVPVESTEFHTGHYTHVLKSNQKVVVTFGMCTACKELP